MESGIWNEKTKFYLYVFYPSKFYRDHGFYIVPFLLSLYFAVIDNMMNKEWWVLKTLNCYSKMSYSFQHSVIPEFFCGMQYRWEWRLLCFWYWFEKQRRGRNSSYPASCIPLIVPIWNVIAFWNICLREMVFWMGFYSFLEKTCSILRILDGPFWLLSWCIYGKISVFRLSFSGPG